MNLLRKLLSLILIITAFSSIGNAQIVDTSVTRKLMHTGDTIVRPVEENPTFKETDSIKLQNPNYRSPRKAAIRSAILPGWGQVYNKKIWKVPIVYAALGGTAWYFFDNRKWFKDFQIGYRVAYNIADAGDSTGYDKIKSYQVRNAVDQNRQNELRSYREEFRRNLDYAAVYFVLAWALNVIDATVDAHLSTFDISPDLTFKIQPGYSELARTNGVSLVLKFK